MDLKDFVSATLTQIVAGVVSLGSSGQSNVENSSVSRVKFNVPLALPNEG